MSTVKTATMGDATPILGAANHSKSKQLDESVYNLQITRDFALKHGSKSWNSEFPAFSCHVDHPAVHHGRLSNVAATCARMTSLGCEQFFVAFPRPAMAPTTVTATAWRLSVGNLATTNSVFHFNSPFKVTNARSVTLNNLYLKGRTRAMCREVVCKYNLPSSILVYHELPSCIVNHYEPHDFPLWTIMSNCQWLLAMTIICSAISR